MPHHQIDRRSAPRARATASRPVPAPAAIALIALIALVAGACGGSGGGDSRVASLSGSSSGGSGATTTTRTDPQDAALAYARCMRQHGIDMPDPQVDSEGRMRMQIRGRVDKRKAQAAEKECGGLLKAGTKAGGPLDPAARDAMVAFARCMRQHGIDMPDPTPDGRMTFERRKGIDLDSSRFRQAEQACNRLLDPLKPKAGGTR